MAAEAAAEVIPMVIDMVPVAVVTIMGMFMLFPELLFDPHQPVKTARGLACSSAQPQYLITLRPFRKSH